MCIHIEKCQQNAVRISQVFSEHTSTTTTTTTTINNQQQRRPPKKTKKKHTSGVFASENFVLSWPWQLRVSYPRLVILGSMRRPHRTENPPPEDPKFWVPCEGTWTWGTTTTCSNPSSSTRFTKFLEVKQLGTGVSWIKLSGKISETLGGDMK